MPAPLILGIGIAVLFGGKKILNAIDNNEKAKELMERANDLYNTSKKEMNSQRKKTNAMLKKLGRTKVETSAHEMKNFVAAYKKFKKIKWKNKIGKDGNIGSMSQGNIRKMELDSIKAGEILKGGLGSLAAGTLTGIAVYGGVGAFATAGTGAAISGLAGVAASNATLAWLGGGTLAAGGAGVAGGTVILGGIALAPVLAVGGALLEAKSEKKLAEAKKAYAEARKATAKMSVVNTALRNIYNVADDYNDFIIKFNKRFNIAIGYMNSVVDRYSNGRSINIDFSNLGEDEKAGLHVAWLMAQILQGLLKQKLVDNQGKVDISAKKLLIAVKRDCRQMGI